jgi:hypothetical protein
MQNQQSECVYEVIRTIDLGEDDVIVKLVRNEVDGLQLIVAHPNIKALEEIMQLIIDTAPISKTSCQSE